MRSYLPTTMIAVLFIFLLLSSIAILYTTDQKARSVKTLAIQALESTSLALSYSAEKGELGTFYIPFFEISVI